MNDAGPHPTPDPTSAVTLDDLIDLLRTTRNRAGRPSYAEITRRVGRIRAARGAPEQRPGRVTVYDCFRPGRKRLDLVLLLDVVRALGVAEDDVARWGLAHETVTCGGSAPGAGPAATAHGSGRPGLPDANPLFVGRAEQLVTVADAARGGHAPVVVVIEGMPGVGKTELAVRAAHDALGLRPAGTPALYVNLHGHDGQPPADPAEVLGSMLRLLGEPATDVQRRGLEWRAARCGRLLAAHAAVVVLDDAADPEQVRPLLPADLGCLTLVTSRRAMAEELGTTGREVVALTLDVLSDEEAAELLRHGIGADRVAAEADAAKRLARLCGLLPLDLTLTSAQVRGKPDWSLADHVRRLEFFPRDELVRPALAASYDLLSAEQQAVLRAVALHPGRRFGPHAAAALAGSDPGTISRVLSRLVREHLVQERDPHRYQLHDVVRHFAAYRARVEDSWTDQHAAVTRLLDSYAFTAALAMDQLSPHDRQHRPAVPPPAVAGPRLADHVSATEWLTVELPELVAAAAHAAREGWVEHVGLFSAVLERHLDATAHYDLATRLHTDALRVARDRASAGRAARALGCVHERMGRYGEARRLLGRAITEAEAAGDLYTVGRAANNLGSVHWRLGDLDDAVRLYEQAITIAVTISDTATNYRALSNLGNAHDSAGRYAEAAACYERSINAARSSGDQAAAGIAVGNLGLVYGRLERWQDAMLLHQEALAAAVAARQPRSEVTPLLGLGTTHLNLGSHPRAEELLRRALAAARRIDATDHEAVALTRLGTALRGTGHAEAGLRRHRQAVRLARRIGSRGIESEALNDLGSALLAAGRASAAVTEFRASLALDVSDRFERVRSLRGLGLALTELGEDAGPSLASAWQIANALGLAAADAIGSELAAAEGDGRAFGVVRESARGPAARPSSANHPLRHQEDS